jgi:hypothetical protein
MNPLPFSATNQSDLEQTLAAIDVSVPERGNDRTTDDCERAAICHFLSTLNHQGSIRFPFHLNKHERPDFIITSEGINWGVEHTEAIPEAYSRAIAIAEREYPDALIDMSQFKFGEDKSTAEIREILQQSELMGDGWAGDSAEIEFANAIKDVVDFKTVKFTKIGFLHFQRNTLLIYENLPRPVIDYHKLINKCNAVLSDYWAQPTIFTDIYIYSGDQLLILDRDSHSIQNIKNLW